jgi:cytochrome c oxidase cbb3-type subunit IV
MIKDLVSALDYSICAEIALGFFFIAFAAILVTSLRLSRSATERFASIPINDQVEDPRYE